MTLNARPLIHDERRLHDLARNLLHAGDLAEIFDSAVQDTIKLLSADRGFLVLGTGGALDYRVVSMEQVASELPPKPATARARLALTTHTPSGANRNSTSSTFAASTTCPVLGR